MFLFSLFLLLFFSCSSELEPQEDIVARVNNTVLTKESLNNLTKGGFDNSKTLLHATNQWIEKTLLYEAAVKKNLNKDLGLIKQREDFYKELLITSYLNIIKKDRVVVKKKEISDYYNNNKKSFVRLDEEILVRHFILDSKKEAEKIKKAIKNNKKGKKAVDLLKKNKAQRRFLNKSFVGDNLVGFVFKANVGDVVGPKKHNKQFHVFELLKKHKKGSVRGLEFVYDEIYQRLFKQKESLIVSSFLDSLYKNANIYISTEVFK